MGVEQMYSYGVHNGLNSYGHNRCNSYGLNSYGGVRVEVCIDMCVDTCAAMAQTGAKTFVRSFVAFGPRSTCLSGTVPEEHRSQTQP